jgi:P27 family predicted phage terminase small subunit
MNRPKPTALKKLQGNPGCRPLNDAEPKPPEGVPECPSFLAPLAQRYWTDFAPLLASCGLLTQIDAPLLAVFAETYATWRNASEQARRQPLVRRKGYPAINPHFKIATNAANQFVKLAIEFGMSPAARSRIRVQQPQQEDPLDSFLKRGGVLLQSS